MNTLHRTALALLGAAILLSAAAGTAFAGRLSLSETRFDITWRELEFAYEEGGFFLGPMKCAVTLEGSFHYRTFAKVRDALVASVTRGSVGACTGGSLTLLAASLPWALTYRYFTGTLPNIFSIATNFVGAGIQTTIEGLTCLATSSTMNPGIWIWNREREVFVNVRGEPSILLPITGAGCSSWRLAMEGTARVTRSGTTSAITLRLI